MNGDPLARESPALEAPPDRRAPAAEQYAGALLVSRAACPVCQSEAGRMVVDLPFDAPPLDLYLKSFYGGRIDPGRLAGGRYVLVDCAGCRLLYQREVPGPGFLAEIYDPGEAEARGRRSKPESQRQRYAAQVEAFLAYFDRPPSEVRVLDYGAGRGDWLDAAAARGCRTAAAEISRDRSQSLAARGHETIDSAALAANAFDFINAEQVFEHLVEPLRTARQLVAALRPGGIVRISVPNAKAVPGLLRAPDWLAPKGSRRSLNAVAPLEHINGFRLPSLLALAQRAGARPFAYQRARLVLDSLRHRLRTPRGIKRLFIRPEVDA